MRLSHESADKVSFAKHPLRRDNVFVIYFQEVTMSTCYDLSMRNNHASAFARLSETLQLWRTRHRQRRELAQWTERDLHDVGLSRSELVHEIEKPFWRA
jgi:uncharacterized protein YjiS (DUF1127 family)